MGRQIKDNNIYSMSTSVTFNSAYKTYKSMHRVQSHKEPVIYLRSIHQIWVILEVVGIDKSKQEVFYRFGTPLTMGCPSTVIIPIVWLMAHVYFQWGTAKLSVHLCFIMTLLGRQKRIKSLVRQTGIEMNIADW